MKRGLLLGFLLIGIVSFQCVLADLTKPSYMRAKQAYKSEDWATAGELLRNYVNEDREFLAKNPDVAKQISMAIAFCGRSVTLEKRSLGSVAAKDDATAPRLP